MRTKNLYFDTLIYVAESYYQTIESNSNTSNFLKSVTSICSCLFIYLLNE